MSRSPNIRDLEAYRRRRFHNPLFNLLTEEFDNVMLEKNLTDKYMLDNFYVDIRTGEGITNERIYALFKSRPQPISSSNDLLTSFNDYPGLVYLLLGKKGTGKTITLKHFSFTIEDEMMSNDKLNLIYLDLKNKKTDQYFIDNLPNSLFEEVYHTIKRKIKNLSGFLEEPILIKKLDNTFNYLSDEAIVKWVLENKSEAIDLLLNYLTNNSYNTYLIIDNVDDFPILSIKRMIDKCIDIKNKFQIKCIVALRDYWNPQNLNIDDTNICSCYLTKPDIFEILKKRLNTIPIHNVREGMKILYGGKEIVLDAEGIIDTFHCIVKDITSDKELHDKLYQLANYDTREHLFNIYHFFHSPYLYSRPIFIKVLIDKIKQIDEDFKIERARRSRFFDFLECFMAIHSLCYDIDSSKIFNIFYHEYQYDEGYNYQNTLIYVRILQSLPETKIAVNKQQIIDKLVCIGYQEPALRNAINILLKKALIESTQGIQEIHATEISISEKGLIYIKDLIYEYSYLLFVCDAIPMPDKYKEDILEKFGDEDIPLSRGSLNIKHDSVIKFIKFMESEEKTEMEYCEEKYHPLLKRICFDTMTYETMRQYTDHTMSKMLTYGKRKTKKIERVIITKVKV